MPRPQRIRLSRRRGARLPKGAVVVARPTKWGNPHKIGPLTRAQAIAAYRRDLLAGRLRVSVEDVRRELRGRDLACWCKLDEPCHADILLEIAHGKHRTKSLGTRRKNTENAY
jgi:hypothetical protein